MGVAQIYCIVILVIIGYVNSAPFAKKSEGAKVKRPFCNAFTGCGRKRSDPSMSEYSELPSEAELLSGATNDYGRIYQVCYYCVNTIELFSPVQKFKSQLFL